MLHFEHYPIRYGILQEYPNFYNDDNRPLFNLYITSHIHHHLCIAILHGNHEI